MSIFPRQIPSPSKRWAVYLFRWQSGKANWYNAVTENVAEPEGSRPKRPGFGITVPVPINRLLNMLAKMQVNVRESELKPVLHILWTGPSSIGKGHKSDPIRDYTLLEAYDSGRRESGGWLGGGKRESPQPAWNDSAWHTGPPLSAPNTAHETGLVLPVYLITYSTTGKGHHVNYKGMLASGSAAKPNRI